MTQRKSLGCRAVVMLVAYMAQAEPFILPDILSSLLLELLPGPQLQMRS